ncbi:hypothetical protein QFZ33_002493 [Arthrobacter globiformis]|nr:hypothetical protein [Arthrobacter globiformis]
MKRELKDAANAVEDASNSRALVIAARAGFAVSGLLHLLIGFVAIQLALGTAGKAGTGGSGRCSRPTRLPAAGSAAAVGRIRRMRCSGSLASQQRRV